MPAVLRPRALSHGDLVVVATPSGPMARRRTAARRPRRGDPGADGVPRAPVPPAAPSGAAGGRRERRPQQAEELNSLLRDPEVRAIFAHTGGKATFAYLDLIDLDAIRADPKPILGYSDISVLHMALYARTGLVGFHADILTHGLGLSWYVQADDDRRAQLSTCTNAS